MGAQSQHGEHGMSWHGMAHVVCNTAHLSKAICELALARGVFNNGHDAVAVESMPHDALWPGGRDLWSTNSRGKTTAHLDHLQVGDLELGGVLVNHSGHDRVEGVAVHDSTGPSQFVGLHVRDGVLGRVG